MLHFFFRVFQALFNLYSFSSFDFGAQHLNIANGSVEGLVATPLDIMYILTNDLPIFSMEDIFTQNSICLK